MYNAVYYMIGCRHEDEVRGGHNSYPDQTSHTTSFSVTFSISRPIKNVDK